MDRFQELVLALQDEERCVEPMPDAGQRCWFGVPPQDRRQPLTNLPRDAAGFHFLLGGSAVELLRAFCRSHWPAQVRSLSLGCSSYDKHYGRDYVAGIAALSATQFPELEELAVGVWELFANEHCGFGQLGNLSPLLRHCPKLRQLRIGGNFVLTEPLHHAQLRELNVELDDRVTGINGGPITNETLHYLLSGSLPQLTELYLWLDIHESEVIYRIPEDLLAETRYPLLERLEISGRLEPWVAPLLQASPRCANIRLYVEPQQ